ncbi:biotin synthase [Pyrococcus furiosus DSM 3638]|uniref:Biotin synthetase n=3 Tax=Pyrococcus furiosus TaxID=2261 RepID=Q8TZT8_PYRFU|nr:MULTISPECIES: DUF257 family protein [Pyrococcus]AAL82019.1 biotin synthetase [Pyrococcus furiosus DSM 3638]AFN04745.1 biotin synthetase [Pyrococcus furiosus COM1]MDK2870036.1 hypothetical protein [Pyrococcus sp.]QEK79492.1 biotin synthase [Pyrococcus furiosus DSM 3638]
MNLRVLGKILLDEMRNGDVAIVEYSSSSPIHRLVWGEIILKYVDRYEFVIDDFFGIGDVMFRTYLRRISSPDEYTKIMEKTKNIKAIKIGPGKISYASKVEELPLTYNLSEFIKLYYPIIRDILAKSSKRVFFITLGLSQYLYLGEAKALETILLSRSVLPIEDWTSIYFLNTDVAPEKAVAALEEISPIVIQVRNNEILVKKI